MRSMRGIRVSSLAFGSLVGLGLVACDGPMPKFSEAGQPFMKVPGADAIAGKSPVETEEASNDPVTSDAENPINESGPPDEDISGLPAEKIFDLPIDDRNDKSERDDLTSTDMGEPAADPYTYTRWAFNASSLNVGRLNYASASHELTQMVFMGSNTIKVEKDFTQIDRPVLTEMFAQGTDLKVQSETFAQNSRASGTLDLLIVVDNSGSMSEEQSNLSSKLAPLLSFVSASDWRVGVVTTDPNDGCLRGLISKSDQAASSTFTQAVQAGIKGSGNERGILQAVNGLKGECNPGGSWLRPQSTVGVLIVSDEDNCSDGKGCGTDPWAQANYLTDYLHSIRQPGINARVYGLIGHPSLTSTQCKTMASKANQYAAAISETGGTWGSICDADYSATLQAISQDISVILLTQFTLKHVPLNGALKVYFNDVEQTSGYTIHENIVEFSVAPAAGVEVRFDYQFNAIPPKTSFVLKDPGAAGHLKVFLDGVETKAFRFDAGSNSIVFEQAPLVSSIKAVYRRADTMTTEFSIGSFLDMTGLSVMVNGQALPAGAYSYRPADGMVVLQSTPADNADVVITFEKISAEQLHFPLLLPSDAMLTTWDADTKVRIDSQRVGDTVRFSTEDYRANRRIVIKSITAGHWKMTIPGAFAAESLNVQSGGLRCETFELNGHELDASACGWAVGANVAVSFDYETEHKETFDLETMGTIPADAS